MSQYHLSSALYFAFDELPDFAFRFRLKIKTLGYSEAHKCATGGESITSRSVHDFIVFLQRAGKECDDAVSDLVFIDEGGKDQN